MGYYSDKMEKLKKLPNSRFILFVSAKVLGGVSIGVLLANWLPTWTWWVFMVIACVIATPVVWIIFGR